MADEVRKLAEQTTTATKEISSMVQSIQSETIHAVDAMKMSSHEVDAGVNKACATGAVLTQVIATVEHVGEMISHIATAAAEQSATTEEINNSLNNIAGLSRQTLAGAEETAQACSDLSNLALDLERLVSKFKYDQTSESQTFTDPRWPHPHTRSFAHKPDAELARAAAAT